MNVNKQYNIIGSYKYFIESNWIATDLNCGDIIRFNNGTTSSKKHWPRLINETDAVIDLRKDCQIFNCKVCFWLNYNYKKHLINIINISIKIQTLPQMLWKEILGLVGCRIQKAGAILRIHTANKDKLCIPAVDWLAVEVDQKSKTND